MGQTRAEIETEAEIQAEQIAFTLFSAVFQPLWKALEPPFTSRLAKLMENRGEELDNTKAKCLSEAQSIVSENPDPVDLKNSVTSLLDAVRDEVRSILETDADSLRELYRKTTEDPKTWGCVIGMLGAALGAFPPIVPATAAVTAATVLGTTLGTTALKISRQKSDRLKQSPWSFAYYLQRIE